MHIIFIVRIFVHFWWYFNTFLLRIFSWFSIQQLPSPTYDYNLSNDYTFKSKPYVRFVILTNKKKGVKISLYEITPKINWNLLLLIWLQMFFAGFYGMAGDDRFVFSCPKNNCGCHDKGIDCKHNLKRHLLFECGVEPQFRCQIYRKRFSQKSSLKLHLVIKHGLKNNSTRE